MPADTDVTTIDEDEPVGQDTAVDDTAIEDTAIEDTAVEDNPVEDTDAAVEDTVVDEPGLDEVVPDDVDDADGAPEVSKAHEAGELIAAGEIILPPPGRKVSRRRHRAEMKASARRVRRVVRRIDTWSVFKVASLFIACVWGIVVLAALLIWRAAVTSGSVENTEDFIVDLGFEDFNFDPQQMFESLLSVGAVLAVAAIFFTVLLTVLFNLICDITGGVRITMIEQDVADARKRRRRKATSEPTD